MKIKLLMTALLTIFCQIAFAQKIAGNFAIRNVQNGMLLRIKDASNKNGTPMVAYHAQNWKCMTWDFISIDSNTYQLKNLLTGKTFQPKQGEEIKFLEEQPISSDNNNQQYVFEAAGKDIYFIKLKGTDLYLTPVDKKGETNSDIILAKKTKTNEQLWSIYEQAPTM